MKISATVYGWNQNIFDFILDIDYIEGRRSSWRKKNPKKKQAKNLENYVISLQA